MLGAERGGTLLPKQRIEETTTPLIHWGCSLLHGDSRLHRASWEAQTVKRLPAMREIWVRSLGWEDPLEKEMATHSSILAWRIPRTKEPGRL